MLRDQSLPESVVRENLFGKQTLNPLLNSVGRPINEVARVKEIKQGDPLYLITTLPFPTAFPVLYDLAEDKDQLDNAVSAFQTDIARFYTEQAGITAPIWILDEAQLTQQRDELVRQARQMDPSRDILSTERSSGKPETFHVKLDINRVIPIDEEGNLVRDDRPAQRAQRPGSLPISTQLLALREACPQSGGRFLLEDTGFASGGSAISIARLLETQGITLDKVIGSVGWFPKAWEQLQQFNPECLIWFDLEKGGWVEDRDFLLLPQSGILVGEDNSDTNEMELLIRNLDGDPNLPIGFTLPDVTFEGRWFRLTDPEQVKRLQEICIRNSLAILDAIKPNISIGELAKAYQAAGNIFTLPVQFGNLYSQLRNVTQDTILTDYLKANFI